MAQTPDTAPHLNAIREILTEFGLPALIMLICFVLLLTGRDGEVKAIMTLAAGWIFKSGYVKTKRTK